MIAEHYDGERLGDNLAQPILERYGFNRVNWVLANTIQQNSGDGRIAPEHKRWGEAVHIPRDDHNWQYTVGSHPGMTNLFIRQVREAWDALGLFDVSHCEEEDSEQDYTDRVLPHWSVADRAI